jgi:nicotinamide-nucleotide amidase
MDTQEIPPRCVPPFLVSDKAVLTLGLTLGKVALSTDTRLGLAESCTGGLASSWVTAVPGSSYWFEGGVVSYSNAIKTSVLGVSEADLLLHGAVSGAVASAMAHGVRQNLMRAQQGRNVSSGWAAASITGVAGPTGGSAEKPVGLVWFGWKFSDDLAHLEACLFSGSRQAIQRQAAWWSLNRLAAGLVRPPA